MSNTPIKRLNWGCGSWTPDGWINSDFKDDPGVNLVADISKGLPIESDSLDYAVSIHSLPEISYPDLVPTLAELRRVLKPGGVLRVSLPDLDLGLAAYQRGDFFEKRAQLMNAWAKHCQTVAQSAASVTPIRSVNSKRVIKQWP